MTITNYRQPKIDQEYSYSLAPQVHQPIEGHGAPMSVDEETDQEPSYTLTPIRTLCLDNTVKTGTANCVEDHKGSTGSHGAKLESGALTEAASFNKAPDSSTYSPIASSTVKKELLSIYREEYLGFMHLLLSTVIDFLDSNKNKVRFQSHLSNSSGTLTFALNDNLIQTLITNIHQYWRSNTLPNDLIEEAVKSLLSDIIHVRVDQPVEASKSLHKGIEQLFIDYGKSSHHLSTSAELPEFACREIAELHIETLKFLQNNIGSFVDKNTSIICDNLYCYLLTPRGDHFAVNTLILSFSPYGIIEQVTYCDDEKQKYHLHPRIQQKEEFREFCQYGSVIKDKVPPLLERLENTGEKRDPSFIVRPLSKHQPSNAVEKSHSLIHALNSTAVQELKRFISIHHFHSFQKNNLPTALDFGLSKLPSEDRSNLSYSRSSVMASCYLQSDPKKALYDLTHEIYLRLLHSKEPIIYINSADMVDDNWWDIEEYLSKHCEREIYKNAMSIIESTQDSGTRKALLGLRVSYYRAHLLYTLHLNKEIELREEVIAKLKEILLDYPKLSEKVRRPVGVKKRTKKIKFNEAYEYYSVSAHGSKIRLFYSGISSSSTLEELEGIIQRIDETSMAKDCESFQLIKSESICWLKKVIERRKEAEELKTQILEKSTLAGFDLLRGINEDSLGELLKKTTSRSTDVFNPYTEIVVYEDHVKNPRPQTVVISSFDEINKSRQAFLDSKYSLIITNGLGEEKNVRSWSKTLLRKKRTHTFSHAILRMDNPIRNLVHLNEFLVLASPFQSKEKIESRKASYIKEKCIALKQSEKDFFDSVRECILNRTSMLPTYEKAKELFFNLQKMRYYHQMLTIPSSEKSQKYAGAFYAPQQTSSTVYDEDRVLVMFDEMISEAIDKSSKQFETMIPKEHLALLYKRLMHFARYESRLLLSMTEESVLLKSMNINYPTMKIPPRKTKTIAPMPAPPRFLQPNIRKRTRVMSAARPKETNIRKRQKTSIAEDLRIEHQVHDYTPSKIEFPTPQFLLQKQLSPSNSHVYRKRWQGDLRGKVKNVYDIKVIY